VPRCQDPYNVTDKNAIEVRHVRGQRIGYVAKQLSARLAPLVKERKIDLKGRAGEGSSLLPRLDALTSPR